MTRDRSMNTFPSEIAPFVETAAGTLDHDVGLTNDRSDRHVWFASMYDDSFSLHQEKFRSFVRFCSAGKSWFVKRHLVPHNYEYVNRVTHRPISELKQRVDRLG